MNLETILAGGLVAFLFGLLSGVLLEKYREQKNYYKQVLADYLKALEKPAVTSDEYQQFGALQRAGIWRLSLKEMNGLAADIKGRGHPNPFEAWIALANESKDYPKSLFDWAQKEGIDFSDSDAALLKMAEEFDAKNLPKPPQGPYAAFLG